MEQWLSIEDLAARIEALWPAEEWAEWIERIPEGPRERHLAFALFALLDCAARPDPEADVIEGHIALVWMVLERVALVWAGLTEGEFTEIVRKAEDRFRQTLLDRIAVTAAINKIRIPKESKGQPEDESSSRSSPK